MSDKNLISVRVGSDVPKQDFLGPRSKRIANRWYVSSAAERQTMEERDGLLKECLELLNSL